MALNLSLPGQEDLKPRITVFGVGGAGGNAVNNMIEKELDGVEFVVANTDAQALQQSRAQAKIQMGVKVTEGLGAGARATVGAAAAEESIEEIVDHLAGAHMCFITAGMGGGTGTGAAPIIAQAARELGVLTVGVVTKPFQFEGGKRMKQAEAGVEALQKVVDTLIIIPNQNLFRLANENTTFTEAFALADDVLYQGVKGVTDLMVRPGLINLDFADVRAVMDEMGKAMMGTGEADGEDRAVQAAEKAIANPLLDEISLEGAKGVLINITGGYDLTLFELDEAANKIREKVDPEANIIVGSTLDTGMEGRMRVSVVATGIDAVAKIEDTPVPRRKMSEPLRERVSAEDEAPAAPVPPRREAPQQQPARAQAPAAPRREAPQARPEPEQPAYEDDFAGGFDTRRTAPREEPQQRFQPQQDDDLPPPAYEPRREAPQAESAPESFVAPAPRAGGERSPEQMARLRAAAQNQPRQQQPERAEMPRAEPRSPAAPTRGAEADRQQPRFGINSLINRMTGQGEQPASPAAQPRQQPQAQRPQPQQPSGPRQAPNWSDDGETDPEQERIEIPAFLRRQAN
ncbi:cell division protein FtsZ [Limimaricola hongkongensis]|uniref:Cell division protein FtsZ n=1 Tax=Limimaricola hongkongensis DSM 17492 TaxID=1122180 RepID=A0A017HA92_9RHOB|nr:cell division protein FtsZ [Limimaricola hongkongensis]EYD71235.1 Cell division protein FtsZ [Limimaricola hongkongensis DSM 17492]